MSRLKACLRWEVMALTLWSILARFILLLFYFTKFSRLHSSSFFVVLRPTEKQSWDQKKKAALSTETDWVLKKHLGQKLSADGNFVKHFTKNSSPKKYHQNVNKFLKTQIRMIFRILTVQFVPCFVKIVKWFQNKNECKKFRRYVFYWWKNYFSW